MKFLLAQQRQESCQHCAVFILSFKEVYVRTDQTKAHLKLTYESKDVFDGGHEDDKDVVERNNHCGDQKVFYPAEWSSGEQQRDHGGPDLQ